MDVVVLGSINADVVLRVSAHPAPGETVLATGQSLGSGGKGANQAVAAARAGAKVAFVGCVGDDDLGRAAIADLGAAGVDATTVRSVATPTGAAYITVADDGQNSIVVAPGANAELLPSDVDPDLIGSAAVAVAQLEIPIPVVARLVEIAGARGTRIVLNLSPAAVLPATLLAGIDVLVVNEAEASALAGPSEDPSAALLARGPAAVVLTLGRRGAMWRTADDSGTVPAPRVDVVDTTGAGDAFVGTLAAELAAGQSLGDATTMAVGVASHSTTTPGARTPAG